MGTIRMNKLVIDMEEVTEAYTVRFHTKSGKMYTRKLDKTNFKETIGIFKQRDD